MGVTYQFRIVQDEQTVAQGSADSMEAALSTGMAYLRAYAQDGRATLTVDRVGANGKRKGLVRATSGRATEKEKKAVDIPN